MRRLVFALLGIVLLSALLSPRSAKGTPSTDFDECLVAAVKAADARAASGDGNKWTRLIEFSIDVAACTAGLLGPF